MIELINSIGPMLEMRCHRCRDLTKVGPGPWPMVPSPEREGAYKAVCLTCASNDGPAKGYERDEWEDMLDLIAMGDMQALSDKLARGPRAARRRLTINPRVLPGA